MEQCIERPELADFIQGKLPEPRAEEISTHIDDCEVCQDTVMEISGAEDTFVGDLKAIPEADPVLHENAFQHGLQRVLNGMKRGAASPEDASLPTRIGPYMIEEKLGAGGMGTVFRAQHSKLKRHVALKVLPANRWSNAAAISRFEREMEAIGQLDHPHIVRASDAGEDDGMHYLVMEYVDGLDLARLTRRLGTLPVADSCELARQAAIGLQHAHDAGLVHRDVKPSNLMLAQRRTGGMGEDAGPTLKLLDLGLALLGDEHLREGHDVTTVGALMGTLDYMSPEQGIDSHAVDHRADIYGLGATLFKLLTGRAPYADPQFSTLMKKMTALATKPAPSIGHIRPDLPANVVQVVDRMLARDPDERFASAQEVAQALADPAQGANLRSLLQRGIETEEAPIDTPTASLARLHSAVSAKRATAPAPSASMSGGGIGKWLMVLAAGFAMLAAGMVYRIATDYGTVVVNSTDPNARLIIKRGSETIDRIQLEHGKGTTRVRSGNYVVEIEGESNGLFVEPAALAVTRNGEVAVTVTNAIAAGEAGQPAADNVAKTARASETTGSTTKPDVDDATDQPDVEIEIEEIKQFVRSENRTLKIMLTNRGNETLNHTMVSFHADNNLVADMSGSSPGVSSSMADDMLFWNLTPIPPGYTKTVVAAVAVPKTAPLTDTLSYVRFTSDNGTVEKYVEGRIVAKPSTTSGADGVVNPQLTINGPVRLLKGEQTTYTIGIKNLNGVPMTDVSAVCFSDNADLRLVNAQPRTNVTVSGRAINWRLGDINPGQVTLLEVVMAASDSPKKKAAKLRFNLTSAEVYGEQEFSISLVEDANEALAASTTNSAPDSSSNELTANEITANEDQPIYDGRTLQDWLSSIRFERKPERLEEAMKAVSATVNHASNTRLVDQSIEAVFRMVREFGKRHNDSGYASVNELAWMTLVRLPHDELFERVLLEVAEGNQQSRDFFFYFLYPTVSSGDRELNAPYDEATGFVNRLRTSEEFTKAVMACEDLKWATDFLFYLSETARHAQGHSTPVRFDGDVTFFASALERFGQPAPDGDALRTAMAAMRLAQIAPKTPGVTDKLNHVLDRELYPSSSVDLKIPTAKVLAVRALERLGSDAYPCTQQLINLLGSDLVHPTNHEYWLQEVPGHDYNDAYTTRLILQTLGNIGSRAKAAIPYVLKIQYGWANQLYPPRPNSPSQVFPVVPTHPTSTAIRKLAYEVLLKIDPSLGERIAMARPEDDEAVHPYNAFFRSVDHGGPDSFIEIRSQHPDGSEVRVGGKIENLRSAMEIAVLLRPLKDEIPGRVLVRDHSRHKDAGIELWFEDGTKVKWATTHKSSVELNNRRIAMLRVALQRLEPAPRDNPAIIDLLLLETTDDSSKSTESDDFESADVITPVKKAPETLEGSIKIEAPDNIRRNETEYVRIVVENVTERKITGAVVKVESQHLAIVSGTPNFETTPGGVQWKDGNLAPGEKHVFEITVKLPSTRLPKIGNIKATLTTDTGSVSASHTASHTANREVTLARPAPQYEGHSLGWWLDELQVERSSDRLKKALRGIAATYDDPLNREYNDEVCESLFSLMRRVGRAPGRVTNESYFNEKAWLLLIDMPLDELSDNILIEMEEGNDRSRAFLFYFLHPIFGAINVRAAEPMARNRELLKKLTNDFEAIVTAAELAANTEGGLQWAVEFLFHVTTPSRPNIDDSASTRITTLMTKGLDAANPKVAAMAGYWLSDPARETALLPPEFKEKLTGRMHEVITTTVRPANQANLIPAKYVAALALRKPGKESVGPLIQLMESGEARNPDRYFPGFTGPLPGMSKNAYRLGGQSELTRVALDGLVACGSAARPAIPYLLRRYQQGNDPQRIKEVLLKIDGSLDDTVLFVREGKTMNAFAQITDGGKRHPNAVHSGWQTIKELGDSATLLAVVAGEVKRLLGLPVEIVHATDDNGTDILALTSASPKEVIEIRWPTGNAMLSGRHVESYLAHIRTETEQYRKEKPKQPLLIDLLPLADKMDAELKMEAAVRNREFPGGMF